MPHKHLHRRQHGVDNNQSQQSKHNGRNAQPEPGPPKVATIVSVVYVTASQTFDGPVGGYTTLGPVVGPPIQQTYTQPPSASATPQFISSNAPSSRSESVQSEAPSADQSSATLSSAPSSTIDSSSVPAASTSNIPSSTLSSSASSTSSLPDAFGTSSSSFSAASAAVSPSATAVTVSDNSNGGMSGGAKAGLALGLLLGIGAVLGLVLFCYRRKKKQNESYEKTDDEKSAFSNDPGQFGAGRPSSTRTARSSATAPRLSLRPVTQFSPDLGGRKSGNPLASTPGPATLTVAGNQHTSPAAELPNRSELDGGPLCNYPSNSTDPFSDPAETPTHVLQATGPSPVSSVPQNTPAPAPGTFQNPSNGNAARDAAGIVAGVIASRQNAPKPLSVNPDRSASAAPQPSPTGTDFSTTSISPSTAAAGAPSPSNVHRVQLDFRPSMEDELELRAGQLVRLLHEYDDGWALCIRLDRSQQGVAPRTCLSARPVKPRPAGAGPPRGPPPATMRGPQARPMSPASAPRPMSPAGGRSSPGPGQYQRAPRPMSPGPFAKQPRSMSPGPYGGGPQRPIPPPGGRRRSNSASQVRERRNSPPGPSPMNPNAKALQKLPAQLAAGLSPPQSQQPATMSRKPVPGQAM